MRTITTSHADTVRVQAADDLDIAAEVTQLGDEVLIQFCVHGGHVPPHMRAGLVDAVLDLPQVRRHRVRAAVPIGDTELITQLGRRCTVVTTHAAGATCLIDAQAVDERD